MNSLTIVPSLLCLGLALGSASARADCDFDDFPRMDGMQLATVAESLQWNNVPMSVKGFRVETSPEVVKSFYGDRWEGAVDFSEFGPWQQVLHINDECLMMVQLQARNGQTFGRLMLVNPPDEDLVSRTLGDGVPVPPDAAVVSDMRTEDRFRDGQLVMLASSNTLEDNLRWYESEMQRAGWQSNRRLQRANDATLIYSKGREQLSIVLLRHQDYTQILLNRTDR